MTDAPVQSAPPARVLIFIVSYEARRHIRGTLGRIPDEILQNPDIDILVIDDASTDGTVDEARVWAESVQYPRLTVLRNPVNQGYGGNQKLGYRLAVDNAYDFVILLHGDGQYAPELLPTFIRHWQATDADVVLGTRMDSIKSARAGGMPWYKVLGNRALTWFQNKLTRQSLKEYHTGYRGYATRFLRAVPFEANTNQFHFDTEILLQAFHIRARVEQFPIPTHYGDEVCRVDGKRYAKDVVLATIQYRMHQMGMLCSLKFRNLSPLRYRDKTIAKYSSHTMALSEVKRLGPRTILDLGCGPGYVARECELLGASVTGVDAFPPLPNMMSDFKLANLEATALPVDAFDYDVVLLLDVIEHLVEPEQFLINLRNQSRSTRAIRKPPSMIVSTPNIAFWAVRLNLLMGRFRYAERGILDITHKRLFTRRSLTTSLEECGYTIEKVIPVGVPFEAVSPTVTGRFLGWMSDITARVWPSMFAFQLMVVAHPRPGIRQLLTQSEQHVHGAIDVAGKATPEAAGVDAAGVEAAGVAVARVEAADDGPGRVVLDAPVVM
jgi:glycosyltransferase involved in cell wall biosynthesis